MLGGWSLRRSDGMRGYEHNDGQVTGHGLEFGVSSMVWEGSGGTGLQKLASESKVRARE
jgi:hypothetical protein